MSLVKSLTFQIDKAFLGISLTGAQREAVLILRVESEAAWMDAVWMDDINEYNLLG